VISPCVALDKHRCDLGTAYKQQLYARFPSRSLRKLLGHDGIAQAAKVLAIRAKWTHLGEQMPAFLRVLNPCNEIPSNSSTETRLIPASETDRKFTSLLLP